MLFVWEAIFPDFYLAIRRWVYNMPVREDLDGIIESAIVRFLRGAPAAIRSIVNRRRLVLPGR
jgi:hypothetical protein